MSTVDIAMATYNGEKYISEQINSIINQSYQNWKQGDQLQARRSRQRDVRCPGAPGLRRARHAGDRPGRRTAVGLSRCARDDRAEALWRVIAEQVLIVEGV